ncbi:hypothetical protein [Streptomyces sp. NPDC056987]|uniref:hypothetical protein n=1 Tax=Streptomyces sp. NPDC056987 TaxID=3345988 RepID=UPI00363A1DE6
MTADVLPLDRLAKEVERRIADLGLEYVAVAAEAGFSVETLSKIRRGQKVKPTTYRGLERALAWGSGSCEAILAGGEPTRLPPVPDDSSAVDDPAADPRIDAIETIVQGLPPRVRDEVLRRLAGRAPQSLLDEVAHRVQ